MIKACLRPIAGFATVFAVSSSLLAQPAKPRALQAATTDLDTLRQTNGPTWRRSESPHFIVYREQPVTATSISTTVDSLEAAWSAAMRLLSQPMTQTPRASVFVTASRVRFAGFVPPEARGLTTRLRGGDDVIFLVQNDSVRLYARHEVMHLVSFRAWGPPRGGAWLAEGLATFADGQCQSSTVLAVSRDLLAARPLVRVQDVVEHFVEMVRADRAAAYVFAGSLANYLWSVRGRDGVRRLWEGRDSLVDVSPLPGMAGNVTSGWRSYVSRTAEATAGLAPAAFQRSACG